MPYGDESRGGDTYLTTVDWKNYGAVYYGGDVNTTVPSLDHEVVTRVNSICKNFDSDANLDYVGVVRWPVGTFMKPHVDSNTGHKQNIIAAMLYLNDGFTGGDLIFQDRVVEPKPGKLFVFKNAENLHYVNKVEGSERFALSFWYHI